MNVLKNKHVLVASLVAPVLALIAWFAVDYLFGEKPHAAMEGSSYALVEKPDCRWESGHCGLKNNDFELTMAFERLPGGQLRLQLDSVFPLDGVMLALALEGRETQPPQAMRPAGSDGLRWTLDTSPVRAGEERIRLVAASGGVNYFGEASTEFMREADAAD
jgi:hypothetical protein